MDPFQRTGQPSGGRRPAPPNSGLVLPPLNLGSGLAPWNAGLDSDPPLTLEPEVELLKRVSSTTRRFDSGEPTLRIIDIVKKLDDLDAVQSGSPNWRSMKASFARVDELLDAYHGIRDEKDKIILWELDHEGPLGSMSLNVQSRQELIERQKELIGLALEHYTQTFRLPGDKNIECLRIFDRYVNPNQGPEGPIRVSRLTRISNAVDPIIRAKKGVTVMFALVYGLYQETMLEREVMNNWIAGMVPPER